MADASPASSHRRTRDAGSSIASTGGGSSMRKKSTGSVLSGRGTFASHASMHKLGPMFSRSRLSSETEDGLAVNKRLRTRNAYIKRFQQLIENSRAKPSGVVAIHIKTGDILRLDPEGEIFSSEGGTLLVYVRMICVDYVKYTRVYEVKSTPTTVIFDELKHFAINVATMKSDSFCFVRFALIAFEESKPTYHYMFATKEISLLQVMRCLNGTASIDLWKDEKLIAELHIEVCFSYGSFGYGYSSQFELPEHTAKKQLAWSMFCRLAPPPERAEPGHGLNSAEVLAVRSVNRPAAILFTRSATFGWMTSETRDDSGWSYPLVEALMAHRLLPRQIAYSQLKSRHDRLQMLREFVIHPYTVADDADLQVVADTDIRRTTVQSDKERVRYSLFSSDPDRKRTSDGDGAKVLAPVMELSTGVVKRNKREDKDKDDKDKDKSDKDKDKDKA